VLTKILDSYTTASKFQCCTIDFYIPTAHRAKFQLFRCNSCRKIDDRRIDDGVVVVIVADCNPKGAEFDFQVMLVIFFLLKRGLRT
jgi:hypothetical protein